MRVATIVMLLGFVWGEKGAFGFGELHAGGSWNLTQKVATPEASLYVQEEISGPYKYSSWSGYFQIPTINGSSIISNHDVIRTISDGFSIGAGGGFSFGMPSNTFEYNLHAGVNVKLW